MPMLAEVRQVSKKAYLNYVNAMVSWFKFNCCFAPELTTEPAPTVQAQGKGAGAAPL